MTDQPDPVGLKKEISGHPTDHSRKALESEAAIRLRDHLVCKHGFDQTEEPIPAWKANQALYFAVQEAIAAPSLPEEGGQPRLEMSCPWQHLGFEQCHCPPEACGVVKAQPVPPVRTPDGYEERDYICRMEDVYDELRKEFDEHEGQHELKWEGFLADAVLEARDRQHAILAAMRLKGGGK